MTTPISREHDEGADLLEDEPEDEESEVDNTVGQAFNSVTLAIKKVFPYIL